MRKFLSTTAIALALSSPAWAQTSKTGDDSPSMNPEQRVEATGAQQYDVDRSDYPFLGDMSEGAWSSDSLIGKELTTADGEVIGEIDSVIFTPDDQILGLIVDAGDYMGVDSHPVIVDWYAVSVVPEEERLSVDLTKDQLAAAPDRDEEEFVELWRDEKDAEVPDVAETQPGVITDEDAEEGPDAPGTGGGGTD